MKKQTTDYRLQTTAKQKETVDGRRWTVDRQNGFTLIEVMVVVVLLGVIFGALANAANGINRRSRDSQRQSDLHNIQSALQEYYADEHVYPNTMPTLASGLSFSGPSGKVYMSNTPIDPNGAVGYCYLSQIAQASGSCDNSVNSLTKCQYYQLCANLEDPPIGAIPCTCGTKPYNFSVRSP